MLFEHLNEHILWPGAICRAS